jgi:hypothetical protein
LERTLFCEEGVVFDLETIALFYQLPFHLLPYIGYFWLGEILANYCFFQTLHSSYEHIEDVHTTFKRA